jgi:hypothetical protein
MTPLSISERPIDELKPFARNARTHSRKQIGQIADSIQRFDFTNPVLIDKDGTILAGHGRVLAAKQLGMTAVPCVILEHMTPTEKRADVLADNKLALNAGWDDEILAQELGELRVLDPDFDLGLTGFSIAEVDRLFGGLAPQEPNDPRDDQLPELGAIKPRCRPGDIWQLDKHRLICGDALDPAVIAALMDGELADMVFTDPP